MHDIILKRVELQKQSLRITSKYRIEYIDEDKVLTQWPYVDWLILEN